MLYAVVVVPVAPVRKKPDHRSEMSNQLFFAEPVKIIKKKGSIWLKIESMYDGYKGWLTEHLVMEVGQEAAMQKTNLLAPDLLNQIQLNKQIIHVPAAAPLPCFKNKKGLIGNMHYSFNGKLLNTQNITDKREHLIRSAMNWLNAPYLWGGKTILGVDCSGFCQTMYKLTGVPIARDARQQALQGKPVNKLSGAKQGDLAFFEEDEDIVHVGILLSTNRIIHASGKVRIDLIDKKGIIHSDTGKRTHFLKNIRRFLE